jgi:23S rRNA (guanosine2251-2'-O)-methyltransferase
VKAHKESEKICRLNPLLEAVRRSPQRINKIWIQKEKGRGRLGELIQAAKAKHIPILLVPKRKLDAIDRSHQGMVAFLSPKEFTALSAILASSQVSFLVLLDGIEDPQNLGAIIRSAEGAGADAIVLPERRSAGLTEVVSLVSAGALEHVRIARVKNLSRVMEDLKKSGFWIVGAEGGMPELWYEFDFTLPVALVFGSEGKGLRPLIRKRCDKILSIPLLGKITSLNVASAASIFFYEVIRQRMKDKEKQDE